MPFPIRLNHKPPTAEVQRLNLVFNKMAHRALEEATKQLTIAATMFENASQIGHEKVADDLLTQACDLLKKVSE